jgi:hypothetical protein
MSANETQVGGTHYKAGSYEPWDFIADCRMDYFVGNAVKYLSRHKLKGGDQDLRKAKHYLEKRMELGFSVHHIYCTLATANLEKFLAQGARSDDPSVPALWAIVQFQVTGSFHFLLSASNHITDLLKHENNR